MTAFLTCELCHGHGYEQTESGKKECRACNQESETLREHERDEMGEKLKPGCCHKCGLPLSDNPHPEAGKPSHYLEVGCPTECIPCTVLSRHRWAERAQKAESELRELRQRIAEKSPPVLFEVEVNDE